MTSEISGAPICAGEASPLRVATGGDANWRFEVRLRRSPARANARRENVLWSDKDASLFQSYRKPSEKLDSYRTLFYD
jgi:hypothetical protein